MRGGGTTNPVAQLTRLSPTGLNPVCVGYLCVYTVIQAVKRPGLYDVVYGRPIVHDK